MCQFFLCVCVFGVYQGMPSCYLFVIPMVMCVYFVCACWIVFRLAGGVISSVPTVVSDSLGRVVYTGIAEYTDEFNANFTIRVSDTDG